MELDTHNVVDLKPAYKPIPRSYTVRRLIIDRVHSRFVKLVENYLRKADIKKGELAEMIGIQQTHLSLLLHGKRPLSGHYLFQFIRTGVFKVDEIYDGNADSKRESEFWDMAREAENLSLLTRIAKLRRKGVDVNGLLDMIDPEKKES